MSWFFVSSAHIDNSEIQLQVAYCVPGSASGWL